MQEIQGPLYTETNVCSPIELLAMRGRKPHSFAIAPADVPVLQQWARSQTRPWYQVQHARMVLAVAEGERIQRVASQVDCDPTTIWRVCRQYEQGGIAGAVARAPRPGRPLRLSPPATGPDCPIGLPGTRG